MFGFLYCKTLQSNHYALQVIILFSWSANIGNIIYFEYLATVDYVLESSDHSKSFLDPIFRATDRARVSRWRYCWWTKSCTPASTWLKMGGRPLLPSSFFFGYIRLGGAGIWTFFVHFHRCSALNVKRELEGIVSSAAGFCPSAVW